MREGSGNRLQSNRKALGQRDGRDLRRAPEKGVPERTLVEADCGHFSLTTPKLLLDPAPLLIAGSIIVS